MKKYNWIIVIAFLFLGAVFFTYRYLDSTTKVRVGVLGDYTASSSTASVDSFRAIEVAINEIDPKNERYELIRFDFPQYVGKEELINKIQHEKIDVILGPSTSSQFVALEPALKALDLPVFLLTVSSNRVHNKKDHFFRLNNDITIYSDAMVYAVNQYLMSERCTVYYTAQNSSFSKTLASLIVEDFNNLGFLDQIQLVEVGTLDERDTKDLLSQKLNSDIVVVIAGPGTAGTIGQLVAANNPEVSLLFSSWGKSDATLEHLANVENPMFILSQPEPYDLDAYNKFVDLIEKENNININSFSISGYENTYFMDWVLSQANSTSKESVATVIHNLDQYSTFINHYYFNGCGDGARGYGLYKIENNNYEVVESLIELE